MRFPRSCGTLVHPTSFPGKYGIGDFGYEARSFIDFLERTYQTIWQVLPLTPTGYGNSPYASYSAFAGNPYLISLDILVEKGLLDSAEVKDVELPSNGKVDYEKAFLNKESLFRKASDRFYNALGKEEEKTFKAFKTRNKQWLVDYALFLACSQHRDMKSWNNWELDLAQRKPEALRIYSKKYKNDIKLINWIQYEFDNQWKALKKYANDRNIRVIGDIPIFVDHNSSDVWSNPKYFAVDDKGNRTLVAGVPPDYFSKTGQLWGNPQYNWKELEKDNYSWWVLRFKHMFDQCDAIRVDHFRGFDAYWEVKATESTAINGTWKQGPGHKFFETIAEECGDLPIIAEDLGVITESVEELRDSFDFPGMKILQFAFDSDATNNFLPHNYSKNSVVYSGTHDNDTSIGWYKSASEKSKHNSRMYTQSDGSTINWEFIRLAMLSVSDQAIIPMQDFMHLDEKHRMNLPGTIANNWQWRYTNEMLHQVDEDQIRTLIELSNRKK